MHNAAWRSAGSPLPPKKPAACTPARSPSHATWTTMAASWSCQLTPVPTPAHPSVLAARITWWRWHASSKCVGCCGRWQEAPVQAHLQLHTHRRSFLCRRKVFSKGDTVVKSVLGVTYTIKPALGRGLTKWAVGLHTLCCLRQAGRQGICINVVDNNTSLPHPARHRHHKQHVRCTPWFLGGSVARHG